MNNLRKVIEKIPSNDNYLFKLECGHDKIISKIHHELNEIACSKCAEYNDGYITHYYSMGEGNVDITTYKKKCHLCGSIDYMCNFEPCKSSKGQYYYSHKECINKNGGYATQSDNPNFKKIKKQKVKSSKESNQIKSINKIIDYKYNCKICKSNFNNGYKLYNDKNSDIDICLDCFISTKLINMAKFKILENRSNTLFSNYIYDYCRGILSSWKHDSFVMKKNIIDEGKPNTVHHANVRYIDILYTALKLCNIHEKEIYSDIEIREIENLMLVIHWFMVVGVPMSTQFHNLYHDKYGRDKEGVNIESLKKFYNKEDISRLIDRFNSIKENRMQYILNRKYKKIE